MPVEGQARRPLSRRDKGFLAAIGCLGALAIGGAVFAFADHKPGPSNAGCVVVTVPSTMGGASVRYCGAAARRFCARQGQLSAAIAAECRKQGFLAPARRTE